MCFRRLVPRGCFARCRRNSRPTGMLREWRPACAAGTDAAASAGHRENTCPGRGSAAAGQAGRSVPEDGGGLPRPDLVRRGYPRAAALHGGLRRVPAGARAAGEARRKGAQPPGARQPVGDRAGTGAAAGAHAGTRLRPVPRPTEKSCSSPTRAAVMQTCAMPCHWRKATRC